VIAYQDPNHEGNSPKHHNGKLCIEKGCQNPAGTAWSHLWCFKHNVERMDRINKSLAAIELRMLAKDIRPTGGACGQTFFGDEE